MTFESPNFQIHWKSVEYDNFPLMVNYEIQILYESHLFCYSWVNIWLWISRIVFYHRIVFSSRKASNLEALEINNIFAVTQISYTCMYVCVFMTCSDGIQTHVENIILFWKYWKCSWANFFFIETLKTQIQQIDCGLYILFFSSMKKMNCNNMLRFDNFNSHRTWSLIYELISYPRCDHKNTKIDHRNRSVICWVT